MVKTFISYIINVGSIPSLDYIIIIIKNTYITMNKKLNLDLIIKNLLLNNKGPKLYPSQTKLTNTKFNNLYIINNNKNLKNKYLIKNYIKYLLNQKDNKINYSTNLIIKNHKNIYDIIVFIYLNKNGSDLSDLASRTPFIINIGNNILKIKPIILLYSNLDSNILSQKLTKSIQWSFEFNLLNSITKNKFDINKLLKRIYNYNNNLLNKELILYNQIENKYIIGNIIKIKGKDSNLESNARALSSYQDNKLYTKYNQFILNNSHQIISKNGIINVNIKFNHF